MTTPDSPDLSQLDARQLLALRAAVDSRLSEVREEFIEKAAALGLAVVESEGKKPRGRKAKPNSDA